MFIVISIAERSPAHSSKLQLRRPHTMTAHEQWYDFPRIPGWIPWNQAPCVVRRHEFVCSDDYLPWLHYLSQLTTPSAVFQKIAGFPCFRIRRCYQYFPILQTVPPAKVVGICASTMHLMSRHHDAHTGMDASTNSIVSSLTMK